MEQILRNMKPEFKIRSYRKISDLFSSTWTLSAITGKAYLPVMISEASADYYYRRSPIVREIAASRFRIIEEDYSLPSSLGICM